MGNTHVTKDEYIQSTIALLNQFQRAFNDLCERWVNNDSGYEKPLDLNDYLGEAYPFPHSFDEHNTDVNDWVKISKAKLIAEFIIKDEQNKGSVSED